MRDCSLLAPQKPAKGTCASGRRSGSTRASTTKRLSRVGLVIEVRWPSKDGVMEDEAAEVAMLESKIGSKEGPEQLRRYAEHLEGMAGFGYKTLLTSLAATILRTGARSSLDSTKIHASSNCAGTTSTASSGRWRRIR
jgi:hypothetical protein